MWQNRKYNVTYLYQHFRFIGLEPMASSSKFVMLARRQKMRETMMAPSTNLSVEFFVIRETCDAGQSALVWGERSNDIRRCLISVGQVWELGLHIRSDEDIAISSGNWCRICAKRHELTAWAPFTQHPTEKLTYRAMATSHSIEPHSTPSLLPTARPTRRTESSFHFTHPEDDDCS